MNYGSVLLLVSLALILLMFSLLRRRGGPRHYPEIVQNIIYDVKLNQALVSIFKQVPKPRRFENTNWLMNKDKIGFLSESIKKTLYEIFALVDEFNLKIKAARKEKTDSYISLDLSHLKELLDRCLIDLEDWMVANIGQKELPPRYGGISDLFFGDR